MQTRKAQIGGALLAAALFFAATPADAKRYDAARKFGRGLAGMTTCFLELPGNIVKTSRERGVGWGLTLGFVEGLGRLVVRPLVGVYEFVTAPFPVPAGYKPILQPEYPWDYFE
jgi:putative exosortase-associated protein (TIGR04073 family)